MQGTLMNSPECRDPHMSEVQDTRLPELMMSVEFHHLFGNLPAMASNLIALASNLIGMASNLFGT